MIQIVFTGQSSPAPALLSDLTRKGYSVVLTQHVHPASGVGSRRDVLLIVSLDSAASALRMAQRIHRPGIPWLAWNRTDDQSLTLLAYAAGASAVLPAELSTSILLQTIATIAEPAHAPDPSALHFGAPQVRFRRDTFIRIQADMLLDITRGVVAQTMLYSDGTEVLLGLYGPEQVLLGHPEDDCGIQLVAQTDVVGIMRNWTDAIHDPALAERLRTRIRLMEAWAAIQARPHLEDRLLGLLGLLAEQFGVPHSTGVLVDMRLTHAQIAAAVSATRSTVTRALGALRVRGVLTTIGVGGRERFCLHEWQPDDHLPFQRTISAQAPTSISAHTGMWARDTGAEQVPKRHKPVSILAD